MINMIGTHDVTHQFPRACPKNQQPIYQEHLWKRFCLIPLEKFVTCLRVTVSYLQLHDVLIPDIIYF